MQKTFERKINTIEMLQDPRNTITEIVQNDYRTADVFKKHGINYCCSGRITLQEACRSGNANYNDLISELEEATRNVFISKSLLFDKWRVDFLIDYIINIHHSYLNQAIPALELQLISFLAGHRNKYPEVVKVQEVFGELSSVLRTHNLHEEEILFPYIKQVDSAYRRKESYGNLFVRTLRKPLSNMEKEHGVITELLKKVKLYTNNYMFPKNACTNHQVLYHKFREFQDDLIQHKHLECNILFPKAVEIEQQLLQI